MSCLCNWLAFFLYPPPKKPWTLVSMGACSCFGMTYQTQDRRLLCANINPNDLLSFSRKIRKERLHLDVEWLDGKLCCYMHTRINRHRSIDIVSLENFPSLPVFSFSPSNFWEHNDRQDSAASWSVARNPTSCWNLPELMAQIISIISSFRRL